MKYIEFKEPGVSYSSVIVFPEFTPHSMFKHLDVVSAGFCLIHHHTKDVTVYGKSVSLNTESRPEAAELIKKLIFKEIG